MEHTNKWTGLLICILIISGTVLADEILKDDFIYATCNNATSGALLCSTASIQCYDSDANLDLITESMVNIATGQFKYQFTNESDRYGCFIDCCTGAIDYLVPVYVVPVDVTGVLTAIDQNQSETLTWIQDNIIYESVLLTNISKQMNNSYGEGLYNSTGAGDATESSLNTISKDVNDTRSSVLQVSTDGNITQDYVDTEITDIKTETDKIPNLFTGMVLNTTYLASVMAQNTSVVIDYEEQLSEIANATQGYVDTEIAGLVTGQGTISSVVNSTNDTTNTKLDTLVGYLEDVNDGGLKTINDIVAHATYGLSAMKTLIDGLFTGQSTISTSTNLTVNMVNQTSSDVNDTVDEIDSRLNLSHPGDWSAIGGGATVTEIDAQLNLSHPGNWSAIGSGFTLDQVDSRLNLSHPGNWSKVGLSDEQNGILSGLQLNQTSYFPFWNQSFPMGGSLTSGQNATLYLIYNRNIWGLTLGSNRSANDTVTYMYDDIVYGGGRTW